jgi:hypothetical protein
VKAADIHNFLIFISQLLFCLHLASIARAFRKGALGAELVTLEDKLARADEDLRRSRSPGSTG